jgi:hypothetical protein
MRTAIGRSPRASDVGVSTSRRLPRSECSASDEQQVAYALTQRRIIFTQDRDFLRLHAAGVPHPGIAYCDKDSRTIGEIVRSLVLIWEIYEPGEMTGRVEFL